MEEKINNENFQYIWSLLVSNNGFENEKIKFIKSSVISPYFELNLENINDIAAGKSDEEYLIETNPFFRFDDIFSFLLMPDSDGNNEKLK